MQVFFRGKDNSEKKEIAPGRRKVWSGLRGGEECRGRGRNVRKESREGEKIENFAKKKKGKV